MVEIQLWDWCKNCLRREGLEVSHATTEEDEANMPGSKEGVSSMLERRG